MKRHPFSQTRSCERRDAAQLHLHNRRVSECSSQESSFGDQCMSPLSTGCHLTGSLASSLSSSLVHHMRQCVVGYSRSSALNGSLSKMTATMGSSHHVFFSPRGQLDILVAQTSKWLSHVRSTRSDVERVGGAGPERFQSKGAHRDERAFTRGQHGFP